jgi:Ser/Thr protein kinase RdoA (MazF antagonist)
MLAPDTDHDTLLGHLKGLADASLGLWPLEAGAAARLLNVSENASYLVEAPSGARTVLRIHREGYHSRNGIRTELAWLKALRDDAGVITPRAIAGIDGDLIQSGKAAGLAKPRDMVMFEFIDGTEPDESHDLTEPFRRLGEVSARLHLHAIGWRRPDYFERLVWDAATVFGPRTNWGDWRDGPGVDRAVLPQLERVQDAVIANLAAYGRSPERFGLAHCDLRLANLLIVGDSTRVIDFDDCGVSWFLYDLATALTLIEDLPQTPALIEAWLDGYARVRKLSDDDLAAIPTLMMMRRMAILAWMGSHRTTDLTLGNRDGYARACGDMAEDYLKRFA